MSKKIAIIESDASFSQRLRAELETKGLSVVDSPDGKAAIELIKREKPDLIVLSVELSAGQSGYIVCSKLKKDDELKRIPVIIIGRDAEGFESHKRLIKLRAEEYITKPFEPSLLLEKVSELIGLPEIDAADLVLEDESLGPTTLGEDEPLFSAGKTTTVETRGGDPDLDMLDAAFETVSEATPHSAGTGETDASSSEESLLEEPPALVGGPDSYLLESNADTESGVPRTRKTEDDFVLETLEPLETDLPPAPPRVGELTGLRDAARDFENRVRELEDQLAEKTNELEAFKSTTGGKDREFFSLREQGTKKDKEILRLKGEVHEKDIKCVELDEKQTRLEQAVSELTTELAKRDAQIKTFTQRQEAYSVERKKSEAALNQAKDELRQLSAKLSTAQGELDHAEELHAELQRNLDQSRAETASTKSALDELTEEHERLSTTLSDELKSQTELLEAETAKTARLEEEARELRTRISELEQAVAQNEERVVKAYQRIKLDEKTRDKTRKALTSAMELLDDSLSASDSEHPELESLG